MYILNADSVSDNKKYCCSRIVASFLIYQKHLPLLSRDGEKWYFAKTEELGKAIKEIPFWMKIGCKF
jgi:hypothetical protein